MVARLVQLLVVSICLSQSLRLLCVFETLAMANNEHKADFVHVYVVCTNISIFFLP